MLNKRYTEIIKEIQKMTLDDRTKLTMYCSYRHKDFHDFENEQIRKTAKRCLKTLMMPVNMYGEGDSIPDKIDTFMDKIADEAFERVMSHVNNDPIERQDLNLKTSTDICRFIQYATIEDRNRVVLFCNHEDPAVRHQAKSKMEELTKLLSELQGETARERVDDLIEQNTYYVENMNVTDFMNLGDGW